MNLKNRFFLSFGILVLVAVGTVSAQSIFDNAYYRKAVELQQKAESLFDRGEYDQSYEASREAKSFMSLSERYGTLVYYRYKANGSIVVAKNRIGYAKGIHADENFPNEYSSAAASLDDALRLFSEGETAYKTVTGYLQNPEATSDTTTFDRGIQSFIESGVAGKLALASLENVRIVEKTPAEKPKDVIVLSTPVQPKEPALPKYYTVRLLPNQRDCLWRIAEYSFVFGDPWKWKLLYELNKDKLPDSKNPDWLEPGIVLEIPSLKGEVRDGMYDPAVKYPALK